MQELNNLKCVFADFHVGKLKLSDFNNNILVKTVDDIGPYVILFSTFSMEKSVEGSGS